LAPHFEQFFVSAIDHSPEERMSVGRHC
jgi:hypothetical protein